jgi:hypothetical protein
MSKNRKSIESSAEKIAENGRARTVTARGGVGVAEKAIANTRISAQRGPHASVEVRGGDEGARRSSRPQGANHTSDSTVAVWNSSRWNQERLERLFRTYNAKYWDGRLPAVGIAMRRNKGIRYQGKYCDECNVIEINLSALTSDSHVRGTLLHEMAHHAAGRNSKSHDSLFFAQLEHLLAKRAPIQVTLAENEHRVSLDTVPGRFRLCRAALRKAYASPGAPKTLSPDHLRAHVDAVAWRLAYNGVPWGTALQIVGTKYGLIDIDGRVIASRRPLVRSARRRYNTMRGILEGRLPAPAIIRV